MGDFEGIGDAITGGVMSRAVEPAAGETGHTHETNCLNCGAPLEGPYCSQCGQHAQVHRTLGAFFHDFLHGVLHFEGKIWRTLPMLAWRPGELTRRYIDGQRARFVSPIALFLFCVFLMFAVMGLTKTHFNGVPAGGKEDVVAEIQKDQRQLAKLQRQRAETVDADVRSDLAEQIDDTRTEIATLEAIQAGKAPPGKAIRADTRNMPSWLATIVKKFRENPELLFYKVKTNAYKFSWALIPISVPFVWLLFPFSRRFRLYDHTVFVTYSLSFMMLLLSVATLVGLISSAVASIAWFIPPLHMFRQLRGTYALKPWAAAWRTLSLTIFAFVAVSLFVSLLFALGAFE